MDLCPLCPAQLAAGNRSILEDPHGIALLHEDWSPKGHAMLVARRHVQNLSDLDPAELSSFILTFRRLELALLSVLGKQRCVVMKLGLLVPHLHLHLYPVDERTERAEIMEMIEARGRSEPASGEQKELIELIRIALGNDARRLEGEKAKGGEEQQE